MKYFFDTYALIEISKENMAYKKFLKEEIITGNLNLGELYFSFLKDGDKKNAVFWIEMLKPKTLTVSIKTIINAMEFKFLNKKKNFSFVDCCAYMQAKELGLLFLTGDKEFKGMPDVEFVK
jgi:uncharacterized protein